MADHTWAIEDLSRAWRTERLAEAARDRVVQQAVSQLRQPWRAALASALRDLASRLDGAPAVGERRLAPAH